MTSNAKPKIGLALGAGGARGWAHIGVIKALKERGIVPDVISGCSMGSIIGTAYICDQLNGLERWAQKLNKWDMLKYFDANPLQSGFIDDARLQHFFEKNITSPATLLENQPIPMAVVATRLDNGHEVWLQEGPVLDAIWASISIPGIFAPVKYKNTWLVDGSLVNPVPVSLCRALGADIVISVNLNHCLFSQQSIKTLYTETVKSRNDTDEPDQGLFDKMAGSIKNYTSLFSNGDTKDAQPPKLIDTLTQSIDIMQDRIARSRMAGDPPDIDLSPRLAHIGILEFYRAKEAIEIGGLCVEEKAAELELTLS